MYKAKLWLYQSKYTKVTKALHFSYLLSPLPYALIVTLTVDCGNFQAFGPGVCFTCGHTECRLGIHRKHRKNFVFQPFRLLNTFFATAKIYEARDVH